MPCAGLVLVLSYSPIQYALMQILVKYPVLSPLSVSARKSSIRTQELCQFDYGSVSLFFLVDPAAATIVR